MAPNPRLAHAGYVVAAYLGVFPLIDAITPFLPAQVGEPRWWFTLFGTMSNTLLILLLALLVALVCAHIGGSLRAKRVVGWVAAIVAGLVLLSAVMFLYGYLAARGAFPAQARRTAVPVTIVTLIKYALGFTAAALLARGARAPLFGTAGSARP